MNTSRQSHKFPIILIVLSSLSSVGALTGVQSDHATALMVIAAVSSGLAAAFLTKASGPGAEPETWLIDPNWLMTAIFISDMDGKIVGLNKSCKVMIGSDLDTRSVKTLLEPLHAELNNRGDADDIVDAVLNSPDIQFSDTLNLTDGRTIERITRPLPKNGQRIWKLRDVTDHSLGQQDRDMHQTMLEADAARNAELAEQLFHAKAELEANQAELRRLANTDALTGLLNRRRFIGKATETIAAFESEDQEKSLWVIMLDIDFFKRINDTYGHSAGDIAIRAFAERVASCVGETGFCGRMGGEEFAVAFPNSDQNHAFRIAEDIRKTTAEAEVKIDSTTLQYTTSVGIACWLVGETSLEPALDRADKALYTAKDMGRNRVVGYE